MFKLSSSADPGKITSDILTGQDPDHEVVTRQHEKNTSEGSEFLDDIFETDFVPVKDTGTNAKII